MRIEHLNERRERHGPSVIEMVTEGYACCSDCRQVRPLDKFSLQRNGVVPYRRSYCNACLHRRNSSTLNDSKASLIRLRLQQTRHRAGLKGIAFDLDATWALDRFANQSGLCFYTELPLRVSSGNGRGKGDRDLSLSFDRVHNGHGYTRSNVVLAANRINHMKGDATLDEMRIWMPDWHARAVQFLGECNAH